MGFASLSPSYGRCKMRMEGMDMKALSRIAVILILGLFASAAPAQDPSPAALAAARDMLMVKGGNAFFDPIIPGVIESVKSSFVPTNPQLSRELNEVAGLLRKDYDSKRAEILDNVTHIFAQHFTEQELKGMTAFYKTPLGQKMLKEEPAAIEESLKSTQQWANAFSETVMARFRSEMLKKGHRL
jgi:uncharacterized protein